MPWTVDDPPSCAQNWTREERRRCVAAANSRLAEGGDDAEAQAIYACIHAAGRSKDEASAEEDKTVIEHKEVPFELTKVSPDGRTFEGYASVFRSPERDEPDHTGDMVVKGAFEHTIQERGHKVRMLWQHDPSQPIGKFLELREDAKGLFVKGIISDTRLGRDVVALLKDHAIDSMSIGYDVQPRGSDYAKSAAGKDVRLLKRVRLWEVSLVTFPADEAANVTALKTPGQPAAERNPEPDESTDSPLSLKAIWQARVEEFKAGQRLNREMRRGLRQMRQMIEGMLAGYEDEEGQGDDQPDEMMRRRKPEETCATETSKPKAENPPEPEASKPEAKAGTDTGSEPDGQAGPDVIPPTTQTQADAPGEAKAGPDTIPPTSTEAGTPADDDPMAEIARETEEIKALLNWR